jgi:hypothetical protein
MRKLSQRAFAATFEFRIEDRQSFVNEKRAFAPNQNPSLMSMNQCDVLVEDVLQYLEG